VFESAFAHESDIRYIPYYATMDSFNWNHWTRVHLDNYTWLWLLSGIYYMPIVNAVCAIQHRWKDNSALLKRTRKVWTGWNAILSVFSGCGAWYTGQGLLLLMKSEDSCSWEAQVSPWNNGPIGLFQWLFCVSKIVELGDTIFLAVLGKPVVFLHWYHHLLTMASAYLLMSEMRPYCIVGMFINYAVHFVMYAYYAFASAGMKLPHWFAQCITTMQTAQMLIVVSYISLTMSRCDWSNALVTSFFMYTLYLVLFCKFFIDKYMSKKLTKIA
jgi:elongation of very long chain fatty acids protein 6